jgi:hypothetical protein
VRIAIADRLALTDLVHLYGAAVDDRRFEDVVELFTDTAELRLPDPPRGLGPVRVHRGRAGVRAAMAALADIERTEHELVGEVYAAQPEPDYALGRITCVAHHWTRRDGHVTDLVWHLRYDDEYLRTPLGWRIHGRALTINAIETRPVLRLRAAPAADPAAAADPSVASSEPRPPGTSPPGRAPGTA